MAMTDFQLPGLGENIKSGVVTKILVAVGDTVNAGQTVLELETDKAVLEVPSSLSGVVSEILIKQNQEAKVGQVIMKIDADAKAAAKAQAPKKEEPAAAPSEPVQKPASAAAIPQRKVPAAPIAQPVAPIAPLPSIEGRKEVAAAPSVRRFAREIGIDINQVPGTGPSGRISLEDVKAFSKALNSGLIRPSGGMTAVLLPDFAKWGETERQAMNPVRKKTAEHLSYAWQSIPHVTQFDKADITELEKLRKKYAPKVEKKGGKLTITPFILKVLGAALKTFPQFNSSVDMARNEIVLKKYFNIGVAVDTDRGLLVPVIRDVHKKSLIDVSVELTQIAERARTRKTTLEEMQGGTFTITNLGGIGGTFFTPIINSPEVAILGISRSTVEQVYIDNHFVPRLMLPLSLSYDHRVIDGADGARFLRWVVEAIQQPFLIELEG